jgi:hypothetical protein
MGVYPPPKATWTYIISDDHYLSAVAGLPGFNMIIVNFYRWQLRGLPANDFIL